MGVKVTNNAYGTLSAGIASGDTTITLDGGQGARFPTLGAGDYFYGTLIDTSNNIEVVKVTARSTDSMTVVRGQDNTTARAYAIGDRFELRPTAALFDAIYTEAVADATPATGSVTDTMLASTLDLSSKTISFGLTASDVPAKAQDYYRNHSAFTTFTLGSNTVWYNVHKSTPFPSTSGVIVIGYNMLMKLDSRGGSNSDAFYPFIFKNSSLAEGSTQTSTPTGSQLTQYTGHRWTSAYGGDEWTGVHATICVDHTAGDHYSVIAQADNSGAQFTINNCEMWAMFISGVQTS